MTDHTGLPLKARMWAMLAIALALSIAVLDSTIVNVALPTIAADFNISPKNSIWIINAYQLTLMICLLPLASLGDIFGYRKVYVSGLGIFCAASLSCALANNLPALTLARVLQGVGAAGILSVNSALIREIYPQHLLGKAIGINAFVVAMSAALGPTIAAIILSVATWPWLFAINIPIALLALKIGNAKLPESEQHDYPFDWQNAVLCAMAFSILIITVDSIGHQTKVLPIITGLVASFGMLWLLVQRELSAPVPLFPIDLLRRPIFALSILSSICSFISQTAAYVSIPFYFLQVLGEDAVRTGFLITPWPIAIAFTAPVAGLLADKYSGGILGAIGMVIFAIGLVLLATLSAHADDFSIVWRMALCGCGFGFFQAPNNRMMIHSTPRSRSGAAGGMLGTARLFGQTIGAALVALMYGLVTSEPNRMILFVAAGIALIAVVVSLLRVRVPVKIENPK